MELDKKEKINAAVRRYYNENKEYREDKLEKQRAYYHENKQYWRDRDNTVEGKEIIQKRNEKQKEYRKEWVRNNKDRERVHRKTYRAKHPEKIKLIQINIARARRNIEPAESVEQHLQDRKTMWYKLIVYPHLFKKNK